ncbi:hypothetical protein CesoFtcFv8_025766 [Champsocephalus esox]|uniref:Uncharacterized protein n=1 Tax=Champsocephalus esox TaxID=159716 RepID=A0AAN8GBM7_9TELE|nr:hypothetical protein CesoFtcFv8_025766 [Champsocephalus esox]
MTGEPFARASGVWKSGGERVKEEEIKRGRAEEKHSGRERGRGGEGGSSDQVRITERERSCRNSPFYTEKKQPSTTDINSSRPLLCKKRLFHQCTFTRILQL